MQLSDFCFGEIAQDDTPLSRAVLVWQKTEVLLHLDDQSLQRVLREYEITGLATLLAGASTPVREKVFANCSKRLVDWIKELMFQQGKPAIEEIEAEIEALVQLVRRLCEAGVISIRLYPL